MTWRKEIVWQRTFAVLVIVAVVGMSVVLLTVPRPRQNPDAAPAPDVSIHYAPAENLEAFDVALIARAQTSIDVAAYVLTDYPVIEALGAAAKRGVRIRILLDRSQHARREEVPPLAALRALPNVTIRLKATDLYMHMKSYMVDGRWLRAGAANFSASGLKKQDNERIEFDSPALAAAWARNFEVIFGEGVAE